MKTIIIALLLLAQIARAEQNTIVIPPDSPDLAWHMSWYFVGRVWGYYDVGLSIQGIPGVAKVASAPPISGCTYPTWNFTSPSYYSYGEDCKRDLPATTWVISLAVRNTNFWIPYQSFTFADLDSECCTTHQGNCSGVIDLGLLMGNCTGLK